LLLNDNSQGYGGSSNAYSSQQQPQQQQSVGYGSGGYGSQQGYTQSYQGYESYQQPQDYGQTVNEIDTTVHMFETILKTNNS